MRTRKAFTLIELIVVIGVITVLIGILLPVLNHVRRVAQIAEQKADFQTITAALQNYRNDFGDYPRNIILPIWNPPTSAANTAAPGFLTLCSALLGPGPAVTQNVPGTSTNIEQGDGADGAGFRAQVVVNGVIVPGGVAIGTNTATANGAVTLPAIPPYLSSLDMSVGQPYEEVIGISAYSITGTTPNQTTTLTLETNTLYTHAASDTYVIKTATGKVWPNYLDTNAFKVAYVEHLPNDPWTPNTLISPYVGQAELLDRWGGVVQYFTRFGPNNNRCSANLSNLTIPPNTNISVGPLYGYSEPYSSTAATFANTNGQDAIWDLRDGAPIPLPDSNNNIIGFQPWQVTTTTTIPTGGPPSPVDLGMAIQWMLGTSNPQPTSSTIASVIGQSTSTPPAFADTLHFDGPFILISAGPDGPSRNNGGFCNLAGITPGQTQYQQAFQASGNIYNFDR